MSLEENWVYLLQKAEHYLDSAVHDCSAVDFGSSIAVKEDEWDEVYSRLLTKYFNALLAEELPSENLCELVNGVVRALSSEAQLHPIGQFGTRYEIDQHMIDTEFIGRERVDVAASITPAIIGAIAGAIADVSAVALDFPSPPTRMINWRTMSKTFLVVIGAGLLGALGSKLIDADSHPLFAGVVSAEVGFIVSVLASYAAHSLRTRGADRENPTDITVLLTLQRGDYTNREICDRTGLNFTHCRAALKRLEKSRHIVRKGKVSNTIIWGISQKH